MKMLGKIAVRCEYGCCRVYGKKGRCKERRNIKRSERNAWKRDLAH